jgi:hypothetical protein
VRVRGQVVGAMEFELDADTVLTDSDLELINEVSQRFGLAAENLKSPTVYRAVPSIDPVTARAGRYVSYTYGHNKWRSTSDGIVSQWPGHAV